MGGAKRRENVGARGGRKSDCSTRGYWTRYARRPWNILRGVKWAWDEYGQDIIMPEESFGFHLTFLKTHHLHRPPTSMKEQFMSASGRLLQTITLKPSKSRQWPIWPNDPQASLGNVGNAATATQLHTPLELKVERFKHQLYTCLPIILCSVSWRAVLRRFSRGGVLTASPHIAGLPTQQHSAPRAKHLKISAPLRIPPSTWILTRLPLAASKHSANTSIVAGTPSNCLPPWLLTTTPSTPQRTASFTSSAVKTPLTQISIFGATSRNQATSLPQL